MSFSKPSIDFIVPTSGKGGVETVLNSVAVYLHNQGYKVRVIQFVFSGPFWLDDCIEFYPLIVNKKAKSLDDFPQLFLQFLEQKGVPDIVIASPWPYLTYAAKKALSCFASPCKIISWMHGPMDEYHKYGGGGADCLKFADYNFVLNQKAVNQLHSYLPESKTALIDNPVDLGRCADYHNYNPDSDTLLFVGRLSAEKKLDTVIEALSLTYHPWKLRVIGDGETKKDLENQATALGISDRVEFLGWMSNPWEASNDVYALVLSSIYEGFPLVAIEALSSGIPVISTPVDGISELIKPGINGYLYAHNDAQGLSNILDMISDGILPKTDAKYCHDLVQRYAKDTALKSIEENIISVMDTISIIIPCYNVSDKLRRCLDSLVNQTISSARLEIICVDDKSTDNTLEILMEYERKYPDNFMIIPLEENRKQGYARNIALSYASGDYIMYIDSDDVISANALELMYTRIKAIGCDVLECGFKFVYGNADFSIEKNGKPLILDMTNAKNKKYYLLNRGWKTAPWGRLYKKSLLTENSISFVEGRFMEDIYFSEMLMCHMKTYAYMPDTLYFYCVNPDGTMVGKNIIHHYMDTAIVQNAVLDYIETTHKFDDCPEELEYLYFSKAFAEPIGRMWRDKRFFSFENYNYARNEVLKRFPNISKNKYINESKENEMIISLALIKKEFQSENQLYDTMNYEK